MSRREGGVPLTPSVMGKKEGRQAGEEREGKQVTCILLYSAITKLQRKTV